MNPEIFKSKSYQKILKHTIEFRCPELSFKEGLKKQLLESSCLVINKKNNDIYCQCELMAQFTAAAIARYENVSDINRQAEILTFISQYYINVGRPITICELGIILYAKNNDYTIEPHANFNKNGKTRYHYIIHKKEWDKMSCEKFPLVRLESESYYLHEQSQEVIDEIANLFE